MSGAPKSLPKARGSEAVKSALIEAAAEMLGEVGPRGISVRDVADRAGVNHGQVHHYFGGKRPLLEAAMLHLARGHYEHARELSGSADLPPVLSLGEDVLYWRAISKVVMEGDLDLARIEIDEGISVPRLVLQHMEERAEAGGAGSDARAGFAVTAAMQLGWVAFEDLTLLFADVDSKDRLAFRERVKRVMEEVIAVIHP